MSNLGKREWNIKLMDTRTKSFLNDDSGVYQVYAAGAATRLQINNAAGADISQSANNLGGDFTSVTMTDGTLKFWTARTVSSVDVSILTAGGRAFFLDGITQNQHRVDVDPSRTEYVLTVAVDDKASASNIRKLGFQLKKGMVVHDVFIKVTAVLTGSSAISNNNWSFGRSGATIGFARNLALTTTGLKQLGTLSTTGLVKAAQVRGTELQLIATGTDAVTNTGWAQRIPYIAEAGTATNNLTMRRTSTATLTVTIGALVGKAYVYYCYSLIPLA